jgi:hypothetical protein
MNQLLNRKRGFELMDPSNGAPNDGWGENLAELEQRALVAKRDAQAKRKQIPPFVQKLRRFVIQPNMGTVWFIDSFVPPVVSLMSRRTQSSYAGRTMGTPLSFWMRTSLPRA